MKKISVEFEADVPVDETAEEIQAWVEFCTGANGGLSCDNPLSDYDLEADGFSVRVT